MKKQLVLFVTLVVFLFFVPRPVFAKDYYFPKVSATYDITADGAIAVAEHRTYQFNGYLGIFWFIQWRKHGKEHPTSAPNYVHNPPSTLAPALVEVLLSQGSKVSPKAFTATLLDLARRKYLTIYERRKLKNFLLFSHVQTSYALVSNKSDAG